MTRVKRGNVAVKRRKRILKLAKGFRGNSSRLFRTANQRVMKKLRFSYVGRREKKRMFRRLWIQRINAYGRSYGLTYSQFIHGLKEGNILLNRKVLSQLAIFDPSSLAQILKEL